MRNGTIEIELPYPVRSGFLSFFARKGEVTYLKKRKIGFSFDQRSMFNLLENNKIDLPNHSDWLKKTPKGVIVLEQLFAGAQSYCEHRRIKDNFTKKGLSLALTEAGTEATDQIIKCYQNSEQLGYRKLSGKKKVKNR